MEQRERVEGAVRWEAAVKEVLSGLSRSAVERFAARAEYLMGLQEDGERAGLYLGAFGAAGMALAHIGFEEAVLRAAGAGGAEARSWE